MNTFAKLIASIAAVIASLALALIAKDDFKVHHLGSVALSGGDYYWICN